jgi:endonuclease-3
MARRESPPSRRRRNVAARKKLAFSSSRRASPTELRQRLRRTLPHPRCELDHANAWQLLVATILSAQSTDARVNLVTPELFRRFPTPAALAAAERSEVERVVHSTGFFRNKARAIQEASRIIAAEHGGEMPRDMQAALALPGVARKTANVVLGTAYGLATGIVVDTHVGRVALRLGLTRSDDPVQVERDLCALFPSEEWIETSHRLVLHGRYVCRARQPDCAHCPLNELCPARAAEPEDSWLARASTERDLVESRARTGST